MKSWRDLPAAKTLPGSVAEKLDGIASRIPLPQKSNQYATIMSWLTAAVEQGHISREGKFRLYTQLFRKRVI